GERIGACEGCGDTTSRCIALNGRSSGQDVRTPGGWVCRMRHDAAKKTGFIQRGARSWSKHPGRGDGLIERVVDAGLAKLGGGGQLRDEMAVELTGVLIQYKATKRV